MFFLIIGIGLAISIERQKIKKITFQERLSHVLKRTLIFIIIQYVYNLFSFGFLSTEYYYIYFGFLPDSGFIYLLNPFISFSLSNLIAQIGLWSLVVFFLMELPIIFRAALAVFIAYIGYFVFFVQGNMLLYMLIGGIFGSIIINELIKGKTDRIFKYFLIIGIIFFLIGLPLHLITVTNREFIGNISLLLNTLSSRQFGGNRIVLNLSNYADYLASPGFIFYSLGIIWIMFSIFYWVLDVKKHNYKIFRPLILWGNLTLTLYVTHFILLNQFIYNLKYRYFFSFFSFMVWNLLFCIFIYIGAVFWSRYNFKYSLEWIIQKYS